jgi:dipeptidyl-peptidase-4
MLLHARWIRILPLALLLLAPAAPAQEQLSVDAVFNRREFRLSGLATEWLDAGRFAYVDYNRDSGTTDLVAETVRGGERTVLVQGSRLVPPGADRPILIEGFQWSPDRGKLLIYTNSQRVWRANTKGTYYVYDLATERLTPLSTTPGWQQFAKWSPAGDRIAFVRDNDLWVVDLATMTERRLTSDGSDVIINGTFDWVYEEELGLQDGFRWSPDGRRIAFWRLDQSPIRTFYLINDSTLYPELFPIRYPKAGEANSKVQVGVIELASGKTTWMDIGADDDIYIARMDWAEGPNELMLQRLNRLQNRLEVLLAEVNTGATRVLFPETDRAWVDVDDDFMWVNGGRQFLWTSERDGFNHLYLYDRSGRLVRQLTRGDFDVTALDGVDEERGWVYFTAARPSPTQQQLFRVRLSGRGMERVSEAPGSHHVSLSPDSRYYIDQHSQAGVPPTTALFTAEGDRLRVLASNEAVQRKLQALGAKEPEFFQFTTSDGVALNGYMIKPPNFDPSKKYPVLMYVYGGPGSQTVTDAWGGSRYLWHQVLAQKGYIVASVDNRGTGSRGRDFEKVTYLNLGKWEVHDQMEAARYLGSLPYVDEDRIGIWGWSYGGYLTALTLFQAGDLFKAGISVAPVTAWNLYDTIYTERFMQTPQLNPEGYRTSAPTAYADRLESEFLLIHGTGDDNVHFQNAVQLVSALQRAGKQFDFMLYPNQTHSISDAQGHLFQLMTDWVVEHL